MEKFGESFAKQSDHATYQNDKKSRDFSYPANWRVDFFPQIFQHTQSLRDFEKAPKLHAMAIEKMVNFYSVEKCSWVENGDILIERPGKLWL